MRLMVCIETLALALVSAVATAVSHETAVVRVSTHRMKLAIYIVSERTRTMKDTIAVVTFMAQIVSFTFKPVTFTFERVGILPHVVTFGPQVMSFKTRGRRP